MRSALCFGLLQRQCLPGILTFPWLSCYLQEATRGKRILWKEKHLAEPLVT